MAEYEDLRAAALRQARAEVDIDVKREIIDVFQELLERLWVRLVYLIGESNTAAIFHSALQEAGRTAPFLHKIGVEEQGIRMNELIEEASRLARSELRLALLAFTDSVVALLTDLTGDILVTKVAPLVQQLRSEIDE